MRLPGRRLTVLAALAAAALVGSPAGAAAQSPDRPQPKAFATGSGKADGAGTAQQHLSFTAHREAGPECPARGSLEYTADAAGTQVHLKARVTHVVLGPAFGGAFPTAAFLVGEIQYYALNGRQQPPPQPTAWFDVVDSGLEGGRGDQIRFEGTFPSGPSSPCFVPITGTPITHGNILIQVTGTQVVP